MKANNECIKAVLNYVIENTGVTLEQTKCDLKSISMFAILNGLENSTYTKEEIVHSTIYASKCGFLDMKPIKDVKNITYSMCEIYDVTPSGYKYLEN